MNKIGETGGPGRETIPIHRVLDEIRFVYHLTTIRIRQEVRGYSLGLVWWFLDPLINTLILYLVTTVIFSWRTEDMAIFLLTGLLIYRFLQTAIAGACLSLAPAFVLSQRLYVPKYAFVVRDVLAQLFKFAIGTVVLIVMLNLLGTGDIASSEVLVVCLVSLLFSMAVAFNVAVVASLVRDIQIVIGYVFRVLFFISGTFFGIERVPEEWQSVFLLNPFALLIHEYRMALLSPASLDYGSLGMLILISLVLLVAGLWILIRFDRVLPKYVI